MHNNGSHPVVCEALIKKARDRLHTLKLDDNDVLYSIRLTGKQRIWAACFGHVFHLLWWDPEHEVCPSELKHT